MYNIGIQYQNYNGNFTDPVLRKSEKLSLRRATIAGNPECKCELDPRGQRKEQ